MVIDFRCRPPYGGFLNPKLCDLFIADHVESFSNRFGVNPAPSMYAKSMDLFMREMEEASIDKVAVQIRFSPGGLATAASKELHMSNDDAVHLIEQYNDKIIGVAGMDVTDTEIALDNLEQYVLNGPCMAVILETGLGMDPTVVENERFYPIYERCQQENVPIIFSYGGFTGPDSEYNRSIHIKQVLNDFPDVKIALCHAAWPWTTEICHAAYKYSNLYLSPDIYMLHVPGCQDYLAAVNGWIPDKMMFASGYPVIPMKDAIEQNCRAVKQEYLDGFLGGNAAKFFGIAKV